MSPFDILGEMRLWNWFELMVRGVNSDEEKKMTHILSVWRNFYFSNRFSQWNLWYANALICKCDIVSKCIISCWAWFSLFLIQSIILNNLPWRALIVQIYTFFLQYLWHLSVVAPYSVQLGQSMKIIVKRANLKKTQKLFLRWNEWMAKRSVRLPTVAASLTFAVFSKSWSGIDIVCVCQCVRTFTHRTMFTLKKCNISYICQIDILKYRSNSWFYIN